MSASPCTRLQRSRSQCFNISRSTSFGKLKANATSRDRLQRACSFNNCDREEGPLEFFDRRSSSSLTPNDIARAINSAAEEALASGNLPLEPLPPNSNASHHGHPISPWPVIPNLPADDQPDLHRPFEFFPGATHLNLNSKINNNIPSTNALSSLDTESWEEEILAPERIPGRIFVILFGVGKQETEGIYSLRLSPKDDDSLPTDTIVAFTDEDDAARYSTLLEASMDHSPTIFPMEWSELVEFCHGSGYKCRLEPRGTLLMPPDHNVGLTDWEKALLLRQGQFQVLETEPVLPPTTSRSTVTPEAAATAAAAMNEDAFFIDGPEWVFEGRPHAAILEEASDEDDYESEDDDERHYLGMDTKLADPAQLEALKQSLERLLPNEEWYD